MDSVSKVQISALMPIGPDPVQTNQPHSVTTDLPELEVKPSWIKTALFAAGVLVLLLVVYCSPLRHYLGRLREISDRVRGFGGLAPLVLTGGVAVLVAFGFPRLVFCVIAGMTLGFWAGLFWAQLGTLIGNYALFLVARELGGDWAPRIVGDRKRMLAALQQRGALGVFLARQLPLPGVLINLACALLPIRQTDFVVGTVIGQLPQAIPCTLIGAGVLQASFRGSIGLIGLAVVLSVAAWFGVRWALRRKAVQTAK
ncbi:MAG TPA: VTT domain-containing protein [Verrucomicrobiae bacterium]|nr:VTT domain-containing protein [Verrucomicrobiae bacterium]